MIVALDQHDIGAEPCRGDRGGSAGRTAADHQHIGLGKNGNVARRLANSFCGTRAPLRPRPENNSMPCAAPMLLE